ncbi:MAG: sensor histidine kinase [Ardenticatenaceae bacterium]|nr:sensor histidine kinase [Ardenticatenaceae bacterium]
MQLARRLRVAFPLLLVFMAFLIEVFEEIRGTHSHFGPTGPHEGFFLEVFTFGVLSPILVGLGFHWIVKVVEQLELARASERDLRQKLERETEARRELLAATVRSQEAERQRVARELHDGIGQPLTAFLLTSDIGSEELCENPTMAHARRAASSTLDSIRRLILDLRPSLLDAQGLLPALRQCAYDTLKPAGIEVVVTAVGQPYPIPDETETALFRIGQESCTNILRHAQASQAKIELRHHPQHVQLIITDDGQGIGQSTNGNGKSNGRSLGLGLLSMKERAEQIGGQFHLQSQPGAGTTVSISVPIPVNQRELT